MPRFWIVTFGVCAAWNVHSAITTSNPLLSWATACTAGFSIGFFAITIVELLRSGEMGKLLMASLTDEAMAIAERLRQTNEVL